MALTSTENIKGKPLKKRFEDRRKTGLSKGSVGYVTLGKSPRSGVGGTGTGRGVNAPRPTGAGRYYTKVK